MSVLRRTAVLVPVDEAASAVDPWRERTCDDKPSAGVPAHITLLFPFVPAAGLDREVIAALAEIVASTTGFEFELRKTARFPATLYLDPEPADAFAALTEAIVSRFPAHPPFEGAYATVIPHLTVAQGESHVLDDAEADVRRHLPIKALAREAQPLEEIEPESGRRSVRARLPFTLSLDPPICAGGAPV